VAWRNWAIPVRHVGGQKRGHGERDPATEEGRRQAHHGTPAGTTLALPGILEIECLLGNPPGGAEEGVRLLVKGVIHFNKSVHESGENVYVKL